MQSNEIVLRVRDFTLDPGPRFLRSGQGSGEEFLRSYLDKEFTRAMSSGMVLNVDLDGTWGIPPSFREEAFGGLVRLHLSRRKDYSFELYEKTLTFVSTQDPDIVNLIWADIKNAIER